MSKWYYSTWSSDFKTGINMKKDNIVKYAFMNSLPVLFGYVFLGIAFGIVLQEAGYGIIWAFLSSVLIYAGSAQFALASLVAGGASIPTIAVMTLFVNSRHIFYGISFVDKFKNMKQKLYMIFGLTDETYSVLTLCDKDEILYKDNNKAMFLITLFNQSYWVTGSIIGSIAGQLIPFDFTGIDFSMTALFVVILVDNLKNGHNDKAVFFAAITGLIVGFICLLIWGASKFIFPALLITVLVLSIRSSLVKEATHE